jgi:hypothetical protein
MVLLLLSSGCCRLGLGRVEPMPAAALEEHARARRGSYGAGFTVVVVPPFVVIGDGPPDWVKADAEEVVGVAGRRLKERYFPRDPAAVIDVLMLYTEASYDRHAGSFFGRPSTPYGYYSSCDRALYTNMTLGNGTLVHELVHALMEANFPASPTWFNEGMGSLYEHTDLASGDLRGRVNWRLNGLKSAIRRGKTVPLAALLGTSRGEFYDDRRSGLHYAMARYLLFHLQERGLLHRFYHAFVASHDEDPTGLATLKSVLGEQDLGAFQERWEREVLALPDP